MTSAADISKLNQKLILIESGSVSAGKKVLSKVIPGAGAAFGAYDAAKRLKAGDKIGAGISGATAGLSTVPGIGTAAALLGTGAQALWDKYKTGSWFPDDDEISKGATEQPSTKPMSTTVPQKGDPNVFALQQKLIAQGAKITADGVMGPQTQAAMKQFPNIRIEESNKDHKMNESQKIASLRDQLLQIENQSQINEAGLSTAIQTGGAALKSFGQRAADFGKGAWAGIKNLKSPQVVGKTTTGNKKAGTQVTTITNKDKNDGARFGSTIASRPAAMAYGAAAAGAAGAIGSGGNTSTQPPAAGSSTQPPATGSSTQPQATGASPQSAAGNAASQGLTAAETAEIHKLALELSKFKDSNEQVYRAYLDYLNKFPQQ